MVYYFLMSQEGIIQWLQRVWALLFGAREEALTCAPIPWKRANGGIWYMGSAAHRAWQTEKLRNGDVWAKLFAQVSGNEGASSAYQNYDNQGVTLGAGFGARGMLGSFARRLARPNIVPLPDDGARYSSAIITKMRDTEYAMRYVCSAESLALRDTVLAEQVATFRASKERYGFPLQNYPLSYLLCHLAHWYPAFVPVGGWTGADSTDVPRALSEFRRLARDYGVSPSETQIAHYVATYRRLGGTHEV